jgi:crotonobetainyl-CoA:carnitine CoA-transferase CaiB-like acyl-CoA transferase
LSELPRALADVRVISFGAFVAGNISAKLLAEMGADVVKVEPRGRPEVLRTPAYAIGDSATEPSGAPNTVMYATLSRGTRNLSLDLRSPDARPVFHRLVAAADILIENFGADTLSGWGCAYDDLVLDNPRLVMLSLSAYGRSGPRARYLGYASTMSSFIGLSSAWGYTHGTLTDYVTAVTGVTAVAEALTRARRTGEPAYVDVGQIDAMAPMLAGVFAAPLNLGADEPAVANRVPGSWLSGVFSSVGDDAWLAVEIEDAGDWDRLCRFLDRPDLSAASADKAERLEPELAEALRDWASRHSAYTGMHVLQKIGLAAAVVQTSEDIWRDPQLHVRRFGERVDQPDLGPVKYPTSAQRWTKSPGSFRVAPHRLGQHSNDILREWLALSDDELADLSAKGAIFDAG